jgi:RNA polymerase sigma factor (sigma-70 family)
VNIRVAAVLGFVGAGGLGQRIHIEDNPSYENERAAQWEKTANDNPGPEGHFLKSELQIQIAEALKQLPEEFRVPILLVDMGDLSYAEAAEILCCPMGTIRSRLSRSRRLLYQQLKDYVIDESKGDRKK